MILQALRRHRRNQRGFTLIELLVVITVIGILAGVVTISVLGVTARARENAKQTEKQVVQVAFDAMLHDQLVPRGTIAGCGVAGTPGDFTEIMTKFPKGAADYSGPGKQVVVTLATFYLRQERTTYKYACDTNGTIYQSPTPAS